MVFSRTPRLLVCRHRSNRMAWHLQDNERHLFVRRWSPSQANQKQKNKHCYEDGPNGCFTIGNIILKLRATIKSHAHEHCFSYQILTRYLYYEWLRIPGYGPSALPFRKKSINKSSAIFDGLRIYSQCFKLSLDLILTCYSMKYHINALHYCWISQSQLRCT